MQHQNQMLHFFFFLKYVCSLIKIDLLKEKHFYVVYKCILKGGA